MIKDTFDENNTYFDMFNSESAQKNIKLFYLNDLNEYVKFDNDKIHSEKFSLTQSICGNEVTFGGCNSGYIKFTASADTPNLIGKTIVVRASPVYGGETPDIGVSLGAFKVVSDVWQANRTSREITAYDKLYTLSNTDVLNWYNELSFPITVREMRNSLLNLFEISPDTDTNINDYIKLEKVVDLKNLNALEVLKMTCEINGGFGVLKSNNTFKILFMNGTKADTAEIPYTKKKSLNYNDLGCDRIKYVQVKNNKVWSYAKTSWSDGVIYQMQNTKLLDSLNIAKITEIAKNLASVLGGANVQKMEGSFSANPCIEIGDHIIYRYGNDEKIDSAFVCERTLTGIVGMTDDIKSAEKFASVEREVAKNDENGEFEKDISDSYNGIYIVDSAEIDAMEYLPEDFPEGGLYAIRGGVDYVLDGESDIDTLTGRSIGKIHQFFRQHCLYNVSNNDINRLSDYGKTLKKVILRAKESTKKINFIRGKSEDYYNVYGVTMPTTLKVKECYEKSNMSNTVIAPKTFIGKLPTVVGGTAEFPLELSYSSQSNGENDKFIAVVALEEIIEGKQPEDPDTGVYEVVIYKNGVDVTYRDLQDEIRYRINMDNPLPKGGWMVDLPNYITTKSGLYKICFILCPSIRCGVINTNGDYNFIDSNYKGETRPNITTKISANKYYDIPAEPALDDEYIYDITEELVLNEFPNTVDLYEFGDFLNLKNLYLGLTDFTVSKPPLENCTALETVYIYNYVGAGDFSNLFTNSFVKKLVVQSDYQLSAGAYMNGVLSDEFTLFGHGIKELQTGAITDCNDLIVLKIKSADKLKLHRACFNNLTALSDVYFSTGDISFNNDDGEKYTAAEIFSGNENYLNITVHAPSKPTNVKDWCETNGLNFVNDNIFKK